jgi:hypothetical protein
LCVVGGAGRIVARIEARRDAADLAGLLARLERFGPPGSIADAPVGAGHLVVPIHPDLVKASRPQYRPAGGKSDRGDPNILAGILRADSPRLRRLAPL